MVQLVDTLLYNSEDRGFDSLRPHYGPVGGRLSLREK